jgi:hypothetical protein
MGTAVLPVSPGILGAPSPDGIVIQGGELEPDESVWTFVAGC